MEIYGKQNMLSSLVTRMIKKYGRLRKAARFKFYPSIKVYKKFVLYAKSFSPGFISAREEKKDK